LAQESGMPLETQIELEKKESTVKPTPETTYYKNAG
jgi:hypothetical protein